MIPAFPKIFAIGTDYIRDIFMDDVEVTEKIDGSQFCFGRINGDLFARSKGAQLYFENPEKMFSQALDYIQLIQDRIPDGMIFYAEYLKKPKHNTLVYSRIPKNHLALFAVMDTSQKIYADISKYADMLDIDHVQIFYYGKLSVVTDLTAMLERESMLGGCKIEGVVVKNFQRKFLLGGQPMPLMAGKFVSEGFKEVHRERWGAEENGKSRLETFFESFRTEARWEKAIQHIRERGELKNEPRDIGALIKEIQTDIETEEAQAVKEFLWNEFKGELKRRTTAGFPEWYKAKLAERAF